MDPTLELSRWLSVLGFAFLYIYTVQSGDAVFHVLPDSAVLQQANQFGPVHSVESLEQRTLEQVFISHWITPRAGFLGPDRALVAEVIRRLDLMQGCDSRHCR
jgi:hypothetical protein